MSQIERLRKLENRMRNPSKNQSQLINGNEQQMITIKSTDSKKNHQMQLHQMIIAHDQKSKQQNQFDRSNPAIQLSQEQIRKNKKITDYFAFDLTAKSKPAIIQSQKQPKRQSKPDKQETNMELDQLEILKEQNKSLKEKLKNRQQTLTNFRNQMKKQMLESVMKIHKMKHNQVRLRVSNNKIRLGQYYSQKKGQDIWIDGIEIRQIKQKLENLSKEKQQLEKSKKSTTRKKNQDEEQKKNAIACQMYFLSREQSHYQQILARLQQQKALHIKQYKLLFQEEHSRYGKIDPQTGVPNWPQIKQYQLLGLLGKGGFSQVYKAYDTEQLREVACKVHQFNSYWNDQAKQNYIKHALRQNKVHKMLIHPNIVRLYDTVQIDNTSFCTILEFCDGPDLSYYLKKHKKIPQKQAKVFIRQVILAIKYLHQLNDKVIHYDLKPQNILFHKGRVKITDFGLCKTTKQDVLELTSQGVGTYWYLPPQCFFAEQKVIISTKVDIWSIGAIYFEMLYGQKPFGNNMSQIRIKNQGIILKATEVLFPQSPKGLVSNESKQFIKACLKYDSQQRIDIVGALSHPAFQKK